MGAKCTSGTTCSGGKGARAVPPPPQPPRGYEGHGEGNVVVDSDAARNPNDTCVDESACRIDPEEKDVSGAKENGTTEGVGELWLTKENGTIDLALDESYGKSPKAERGKGSQLFRSACIACVPCGTGTTEGGGKIHMLRERQDTGTTVATEDDTGVDESGCKIDPEEDTGTPRVNVSTMVLGNKAERHVVECQ